MCEVFCFHVVILLIYNYIKNFLRPLTSNLCILIQISNQLSGYY